MVEDGIKNGIYRLAEDNTLKDLKLFNSFLCRNCRKYEHCEEDNFMALQRQINLPTLMKQLLIILSSAQ